MKVNFKSPLWILFFVFILILVLALVFKPKAENINNLPRESQEEEAKFVKLYDLKKPGSIGEQKNNFLGSVFAENKVDIFADRSGEIIKIYKKNNDFIRKDEIVFDIEKDNLSDDLDNARKDYFLLENYLNSFLIKSHSQIENTLSALDNFFIVKSFLYELKYPLSIKSEESNIALNYLEFRSQYEKYLDEFSQADNSQRKLEIIQNYLPDFYSFVDSLKNLYVNKYARDNKSQIIGELNNLSSSLVAITEDPRIQISLHNKNFSAFEVSFDGLDDTIKEIEDNISETIIKSPIDGQIVDFNLVQNEKVNTGQKLFSIESLNKKIRAYISRDQRNLVFLGQNIYKKDDGYFGRISKISSDLNREQKFEIEIEANGLFANEEIFSLYYYVPVHNALSIPFSAVLIENKEYFVLIYDGDNKKPLKRKIEINEFLGDKVSVLSGLSGDERIILNASSASENQLIKIY